VHGVTAARAKQLEQAEGEEEVRREVSGSCVALTYEDAGRSGRRIAQRSDADIDEAQDPAVRVVVELVIVFEESPRPTRGSRERRRWIGVGEDLDDGIGQAIRWLERAEARRDSVQETWRVRGDRDVESVDGAVKLSSRRR
jgi:hypothetical protein